MPAEPIAEQVAGEEPAIAANRAQANTLAMPSPPGTLCSQVWMAEYRSLPAGDLPIAAPFRMNRGIDSSVIDAISSYTFWVIVSSEDEGMKKYMKPVATTPRAKAIGIPENITTSVTAPYNAPKVKSLIERSACW